jgi:hypothetical protein
LVALAGIFLSLGCSGGDPGPVSSVGDIGPDIAVLGDVGVANPGDVLGGPPDGLADALSDNLADSPAAPDVLLEDQAAVTDNATSAAPIIDVIPTAYQFSYVSPQAEMLTKDIEIYNIGDAPLELTSIAFTAGSSADFSFVLVPPLPKVLASWDSTLVRVRFTEGDGGPATLRVASNDPANPEVDVMFTSHLKATLIIDLDLNIDGDCVTATCPAEAPYPVACNVIFDGGDNRGCVASTPTSPVVYFQEGNVCGAGHVSGTLSCSDTQGAPLSEINCPINKLIKLYPASQSGCPAT